MERMRKDVGHTDLETLVGIVHTLALAKKQHGITTYSLTFEKREVFVETNRLRAQVNLPKLDREEWNEYIDGNF